MAAVARPYGVGHRRARPTAARVTMEENPERSPIVMAEPVSGPVLAAIADPLRLTVLIALETRQQTVAELAVALEAPEPAVERAIAVLYDAGLVRRGDGPGRLRATGRGWLEIARRLRTLDRESRDG
jgi:DNA-binding transcriptional ArsR family regulator